MTDGEAFLLVFVAIYLSDCLVWLTPPAHAVISYWGRYFEVRRSAVFLPGLKKGFAMLQPLPPLGTVFVGEGWLITAGEVGVSPVSRENPNPGRRVAPPSGSGFLRWKEIESLRAEDNRILINGRVFCQCATAAGAHRLAAWLGSLKGMTPMKRNAAISGGVRRSFDERRASRKVEWFRRAVRPLRWTCSLLFFAVFVVVPFSYWRFEDELPFFVTLGAVWLLMWQATLEFWFLHRRLYPALKQDRWQHAILSVLFPQHAIRSIDALSRGFLSELHPLAVMAAAGTREDFLRFADRIRRDALHPIPLPEREAPDEGGVETFRTTHWIPALEALLERRGFDGAPPSGSRDGSPAECPRCAGEYQRAGVPCNDCGGILTVERPCGAR